jgi:hypothetical protein
MEQLQYNRLEYSQDSVDEHSPVISTQYIRLSFLLLFPSVHLYVLNDFFGVSISNFKQTPFTAIGFY